jgi:hypothetical protein
VVAAETVDRELSFAAGSCMADGFSGLAPSHGPLTGARNSGSSS